MAKFDKDLLLKNKNFKVINIKFLDENYEFITSNSNLIKSKKMDDGSYFILDTLYKNIKGKTNLELNFNLGYISLILAKLFKDKKFYIIENNKEIIDFIEFNRFNLNVASKVSILKFDYLKDVENYNFDNIFLKTSTKISIDELNKIFTSLKLSLNKNGSLYILIKMIKGAILIYKVLENVFGENNIKIINQNTTYQIIQAENK